MFQGFWMGLDMTGFLQKILNKIREKSEKLRINVKSYRLILFGNIYSGYDIAL